MGPLSHSVLYLGQELTQHSPSSDFEENQLSRGLISLSLLLTSHLRIFQHPRVRPSTQYYQGLSLLISRSPPLRVCCQRRVAHLALGFPRPALLNSFGRPPTTTRRLIMQKASSHPIKGSYTLYAAGCRFCFTPLKGVLFTFPSRYWFTIGCQVVFSLIRWSGQIHTKFHVHCATWGRPTSSTCSRKRLSRAVAFLSRKFRLLVEFDYGSPTTLLKQVSAVWACPLSLAATDGITFVFCS